MPSLPSKSPPLAGFFVSGSSGQEKSFFTTEGTEFTEKKKTSGLKCVGSIVSC
jgi:hypothetical protein